MQKAIIEPHYLPSIEYFCALFPFDEVVLEGHEYFVKQTYRNRCHVNTSQGVQKLIVPTVGNNGKVRMGEVKIDPSPKWRNSHWRSLEAAYRKAPYFEYYSDDLKKILFLKHDLLHDLNKDLLSFCLRSIGLSRSISETVSFSKDLAPEFVDLRNILEAKKSHSDRILFRPVSYVQVFGNVFVQNLSVVDLLFCVGPRSIELIKSSSVPLNK